MSADCDDMVNDALVGGVVVIKQVEKGKVRGKFPIRQLKQPTKMRCHNRNRTIFLTSTSSFLIGI